MLAGGGALTVALSGAVSLASFANVDLASAAVNGAVSQAKSFLDLMHQRSPGQRTEAHLTKIKHKHYRVLAERAPPPPAIIVPAYNPEVGLVAPPLSVPVPGFPEAPQLALLTPPHVYQSPPPGVGIFPPPPPKAPPPPTPLVPEPSSWAMLIVGFGAAGWMMRRTRATQRISIG